MQRQSALLDVGGARLLREDLLLYENALRDCLAGFVSFKSHSLYFPQSVSPGLLAGFGPELDQAVLLSEERRLFLPLTAQGALLGVFVAKEVKPLPRANLLALLPGVAALCLERLRLHKAAVTDPVTGLFNRHRLLGVLEREIDLIHELIMPGSAGYLDPTLTGSRGCFGLFVLDVDGYSRMARRRGRVFAERILAQAAEIVRAACPEDALAARAGDNAFAVFLPGASPAKTRETAGKAREALRRARFEDPAVGDAFVLTACSGQASYPRDARGGEFVAPAAEQARIMLAKTEKALSTAKTIGRDRGMDFGRILSEGGVVVSVLPQGRLAVSLGRAVNAEGGQRFLAAAPDGARDGEVGPAGEPTGPAAIKGEIILMEAGEETSFAEILHVGDPAWPIAPGDRLLLAPEPEAASDRDPAQPPQKEPFSGLFGHKDFLRRLAGAMERRKRFSLALFRLPDEVPAERASPSGRHVEADVREIAAMCRAAFGPDVEGGRFSATKLLFSFPGKRPDEILEQVAAICEQARERLGLDVAAGLAGFPYLNFAKTDVAENCRKALEHALLLPESPRAAVFDSISMTISADRRFTQGDLYAAAEEYKLALAADEENLLALNSLGVCHARLGQMAKARTLFEKAVKKDPRNAMALYNLGCAQRRLGETVLARKSFQKCLRLNPADVYSLLRLGRMAEESGRHADAFKYYKRAEGTEGGGAALRHLARLAAARDQTDAAREYLRQALIYDPRDAFSLHLMARLYLDGGDDPAIAEAMARQSAALRPERPEFWRELARALEAQGKVDEARTAFARAGA